MAKEAERGSLPPHELFSLQDVWTTMVSTSIQELELPDYNAFCAALGLPMEWLRRDGSVNYMKLADVPRLSSAVTAAAVRSPCKSHQVALCLF